MEFNLNDEQKMVLKTVRKFVKKELIPLESRVLSNEREGLQGIAEEEIRKIQLKAKAAGLWGISTPEEYGGVNLGLLMSTLIQMELGKTFIPFQFGGEAAEILYYCNVEQKMKYLIPTINGERKLCFALTEPNAGSDAAAIRMTAVKKGSHWVLNGEKTFISDGHEADFVMVFAVTDKEKRANGGITCFLVDRYMGWKSYPIQTIDGSKIASLVFEDVTVPEENILTGEGQGFELILKTITRGRCMLPALALGAAERLLQMGIDYANARIAFGKSIGEYQAIQVMLADSAVEIQAAKLLVLNAAWASDNGKDARHLASIAKLYGAGTANRVVDRVLQVHGGMGLTKEMPIERWYRELRKYRIFEGTDEILRRTIARNLLKGHVKIGQLD